MLWAKVGNETLWLRLRGLELGLWLRQCGHGCLEAPHLASGVMTTSVPPIEMPTIAPVERHVSEEVDKGEDMEEDEADAQAVGEAPLEWISDRQCAAAARSK